MRHVDSCNDLVSAQQQVPRDGETNRLRDPLVDDQPALRLLVEGQLGRTPLKIRSMQCASRRYVSARLLPYNMRLPSSTCSGHAQIAGVRRIGNSIERA